jgi:Phosphotransferase system cellobiose-specific component IIC
MSLYDIIYTFLQKPLEGVMQGLPGLLILMFVAQLFWCIGIHGNQIIKPVRDPLLNAAILANTEMVAQGITDVSKLNIINMSFWDTFMSLGGSGCTLGLLIAILVLSKRSDYRAIAKLEAAPAVFEINEPMTFGLPIVLNPLLVVPFIITPLVTGSFAYFMTKIGFAGVCIYAMPWTTPPILSAWLATGGNLGAVITQILCIAISILIYAPFVLVANKAAAEELKEVEAQA